MSTFFISDLHFGHKNILEFSRDWRVGATIEEHDAWLVSMWNSTVTKRDLVWVLGDVAMRQESISNMGRLNGRKKLVLGNHDFPDMNLYTPYFEDIAGMVSYKEFWLTHSPMYGDGLRKKTHNIHGHVHHRSIQDPRYINVCVEVIGGRPVSLDQIRNTCKTPNSP